MKWVLLANVMLFLFWLSGDEPDEVRLISNLRRSVRMAARRYVLSM